MKSIQKLRKSLFCFSFLMMSSVFFAAPDVIYISPNNDGRQDVLELPLSITDKRNIQEWSFIIADESGKTIRTISNKEARPAKLTFALFFKRLFSERSGIPVPKTVTWDGRTDSGALVQDGTYYYYATATDASGNSSREPSAASKQVGYKVIVDTTPPTVSLTQPDSAQKVFGGSTKPSIAIRQTGSTEAHWTAIIRNDAGKIVRSIESDNASPQPFEWDGKDDRGSKVEEGVYTYSIVGFDNAGNMSVPASITNIVYALERNVYITAENAAFSPNGDGKFETQRFNITASEPGGITSWELVVTNRDDKKTVFEWNNKKDGELKTSITWNGQGADGQGVDGILRGELTVLYSNGSRVKAVTGLFLSAVTPPKLSVKLSSQYFSPDNDGENDELGIGLKAEYSIKGEELPTIDTWSFVINDANTDKSAAQKEFWRQGGKNGLAPQITWDGVSASGDRVLSAMDYPYVFSVTDSLGLTASVTGEIPVDILVVREGNTLKILVPAITFRPDHADFDVNKKKDPKQGLDQDVIDRNLDVLKRVARALNKYKEYTVTIEGHAHNVSGSAAEGEADKPLSAQRAEAVRNQLVKYGVARDRLSTIGMGGTKTIAKSKDEAWKNRRVEFILNK